VFGNKAAWVQVLTRTSNVHCKQSQHVFPFHIFFRASNDHAVTQQVDDSIISRLGAIMHYLDLFMILARPNNQLLSPPVARWSETMNRSSGWPTQRANFWNIVVLSSSARPIAPSANGDGELHELGPVNAKWKYVQFDGWWMMGGIFITDFQRHLISTEVLVTCPYNSQFSTPSAETCFGLGGEKVHVAIWRDN
jgi:hypothetical protein